MSYNNDVQNSSLTVKKLGWKRIAKNKERFGWTMTNAEKETTTTYTTTYEGRIEGDTLHIMPHTSSTSKIRINLYFARRKSDFTNLGAIYPIELIYNLVFLIRRIIAFFLPVVFVASIVFMFLNFTDLALQVITYWGAALIVWVVLILLEGILARIAAAILKYN